MRIESEGFELMRPLSGGIAESLDTDAARQAAFDRGFDQNRGEEGERDGQVDLADAAPLASGNLLGLSD